MFCSDLNQLVYFVITNEVDKKNASKIADLLLREKLIPFVSFKNNESHFWWKGEINKSKEVQLIIKCKEDNIRNICGKISENHSYELPEIIYFPVSVNNDYYLWLNSF